MSDAMDEQEVIKRRTQYFEEYLDILNTKSVQAASQEGVKYRCPCCSYKTLDERGGYDICPVCFWEDDGQDDEDAETNRPLGPNHMSLVQAREMYRRIGACEERLLVYVRPPLPEEE